MTSSDPVINSSLHETENDTRSPERLLKISDSYVEWNINAKESHCYIAGGVFVVILFIIGLPGNSVVLYVYHYHFKESTANMFIKVLATLDIICCIFGMTYEMVDMFFPLLNGEPYSCKLFRTIEQTVEYISCEMLLLIAYDRYLHICKPFEMFPVSKARQYVYILIAAGCLLSSPTALLMGRKQIDIKGIKFSACSVDSEFENTLFAFIYYVCIYSSNLISFIIMVILYVLIWSAIYKWQHSPIRQNTNVFVTHTSELERNDNIASIKETSPPTSITVTNLVISKSAQEVRRAITPDCTGISKYTPVTKRQKTIGSKRKVVKPVIILFAVTSLFIISFFPYFALLILLTTGSVKLQRLSIQQRQLWEVFYKSYFMSNALNPILYCILDHRFRKTVYDVLFRSRHYERMCCRKS